MEMLGEDAPVPPVHSEDETKVVQAAEPAFASSTLTAQAEGGAGMHGACWLEPRTADPAPCHTVSLW